MNFNLVNELGGGQRAQSRGERSLESRDEFLAVVAHELRTPLNAISGWAQLIARGVDAETLSRAIDVIIRSTKAQERIISDLYDAASVLSGKFSMTLRLLDLSKILAEEVETVLPVAAKKKIYLEQHIANEKLAVYADEGRLRQVICNLLNNAVKFTPEGGSVDVWCALKDSAAQITVSDTGCGIEPEILDRIFERSFQAGCGNGLGLGLAIARHIIEQHGGSIFAASPGADQGATFIVQIPIAEVI